MMHRRQFLHGAASAPLLLGTAAAEAQTPVLRVTVRNPTIVAHGGGRLTRGFFSDFSNAIGKPNARLLISPYGSKDLSKRASRELEKLRVLNYSDVSFLDLSSSRTARSQIQAADVIWFSGGSQRRHVEELRSVFGVRQELMRAYTNGVVVSGSAGGISILSRLMITGGKEGNVKTGRGIGFWRNVVLDQRVDRRSRQFRLREVISANRRLLGLGLDDRTWISYSEGIATVKGRGKVRLVYWSDGINEREYRSGTRLKLPE